MSEVNYSIERDLSEAQALADHLVPYVYESELYGSVGGMFGSGSMPRLTLGGLLMRLSRLHALEDHLTPDQRTELAAVDAQHERVRQEWTVHYADKLLQEAMSRLKMIEQFFIDCADDPRTCAANYPPEAMRRTIVEVIRNALDEPDAALDRATSKVDSQLHRFAQPSDFIWANALQPAYPPDEYWWLYAKPSATMAGNRSMRLFIAIELPPDVKAQLGALRSDIPGATWVKPTAMHLTLRFLGDRIDPVRLTPIVTALESVTAAPFSVALRGTGRFPQGTKRPPRVLWVGIESQPALTALHAAVERAVAAVGFPPEARGFSPHITLARLKSPDSVPQVVRFLDRQRSFRAEPFTAAEFHLISSQLTPQGAVYRHEASFPLRD